MRGTENLTTGAMRSSSAGLVGTIEEATGPGGEGTAREAAYQSIK
jgi:hypothetical protein